ARPRGGRTRKRPLMTDHTPEVIVHQSGSTPARRTLFGYRTGDHARLDAVQNAISAVCAVIAGAAIVVIAVLTTVEVATSTFVDTPLGWNVGFVVQYLMMAVAFFGTVTAYRTGAHVAVVTIFEKASETVRKLMLVVVYAVTIVVLY